jgi:DNA primase catalytic core
MEYKQLSFSDAVELIARDNGILVEYEKNGKTPEQVKAEKEKKESLSDFLNRAGKWFADNLSKATNIGYYLHRLRGIHSDTAVAFGLGYAPIGDVMSTKYKEQALATGLASQKEHRIYDTMQNRLTIALHDRRGVVIGYSGRAMGDQRAKYINPPDTELFKKNEYVFGIHQAERAIRTEGFVYLVEGYFNVMRLYQNDICNVVACMGTALTDEQIRIIKRYTKAVVLLYDADSAGLKATKSAIKRLLKEGFTVKVFDWQSYDDTAKTDIDDIGLIMEGYEGLLQSTLREQTIQWLDWWMKYTEETGETDIDAAIYTELADMIISIPDEVMREMWQTLAIKIRPIMRKVIRSRKKAANNDDEDEKRIRVRMDDTGTQVINGRGYMTHIGDFKIAMLYQLQIKSKNDCKWIVKVWRAGEEPVFIVITNDDLHSTKNLKKVFFRERYPLDLDEKQLSYLLEFLLEGCKYAEEVSIIGWHREAKMFFFANAAYDPYQDKVFNPNELSIVEKDGYGYAMPYTNEEKVKMMGFEEQARYKYEPSPITLRQIADFIREGWGETAMVALSFAIATMFIDHVSMAVNPLQNFFPILYLKGYAGSGKSTLANLLANFFGNSPTSISLGSVTPAAIPKRIAKYSGTVMHLEDYGSNRDELPKITALLNGFWERRSKEMTSQDNIDETKSYPFESSIVVTSNILPQDPDNRLQTRVIFMLLNQTSRTQEQRKRFSNTLEMLMKNSWTHVTTQVMRHREVIEQQFQDVYNKIAASLKDVMVNYHVEDRIINNYAQVLTVPYILIKEGLIDIGVRQLDLAEIFAKNLRNQVSNLAESTPLEKFWEILQAGYEKYMQARRAAAYVDDNGTTHFKEVPFSPMYFMPDVHFKVDDCYMVRHLATPAIKSKVIKLKWNVTYDFYKRQCDQLRTDALPKAELRQLLMNHPSYDKTPITWPNGKQTDLSYVKSIKMNCVPENNDGDSDKQYAVGEGFVLHYDKLKEDFGISITS